MRHDGSGIYSFTSKIDYPDIFPQNPPFFWLNFLGDERGQQNLGTVKSCNKSPLFFLGLAAQSSNTEVVCNFLLFVYLCDIPTSEDIYRTRLLASKQKIKKNATLYQRTKIVAAFIQCHQCESLRKG